MRKLKLSILDQSVIRPGGNAKDAINETVATVKLAEELGYSRFWVSEHHNSALIAGSTPEVLMVKLADATNAIRIGSGGIMLPNHSALKVVENFRMLEVLFPNRIDLGIGRAPGTDRITSSILNPSNDFSEASYLQQLEYMQHFFKDTAATKYGSLLATPRATTIPSQWILSSSGSSSLIAAKFGMGLSIAKFINGLVIPQVAETYRKNFKPSAENTVPQVIVAVQVVCAETEEKANQMRKFIDFVFVQFEKGNFNDFKDGNFIKNYGFSPFEQQIIERNKGRIISGTTDDVKEQLIKLSNDFETDEIMITSMSVDYEARRKSFELLANAFELKHIT
ncbi:MsnO8 family LLM class oxidoreductase [Maribellus comscasis]|jgi:luciferase family oxidoreductase group 1|uniref:MsnO8 family LLM class oxidoreductase n=1 Tax=Maribellus comscasis TaxID=2681766 RepID=A0A6I6JTQ5_9BACT|nr:LLM class flavin-dependent oxidoreductase [Maribellus comscasis]MBN2747814.1 LLM class flavin-dependent oxidoreductase [Bacteroidales bacterium]QGY45871.1 MsnO8 family LLM class oxidoreductase [Maribellus comscasis]